jgi:hypothetical protein
VVPANNFARRNLLIVGRLRAGTLPSEELDGSPLCHLLHCVLKSEASVHAAIERAGGGGWRRWCWPRVQGELCQRSTVVVGPEDEHYRAARRAHYTSTATVPQFLLAELHPESHNSRNIRLRAACPGAVWTCGNWLVRPNPFYYDYETFTENPLAAKDDVRGFEITPWWIHPHLQRGSSCFGQQPLAPAEQPSGARRASATGDTAATSVVPASLPGQYMYSAVDFGASQLNELMELDAAIRAHMSQYYGIDAVKEDDIFFHGLDMCQNAKPWYYTAHLHVIHNRPRRVDCFQQSITLATVIRHITEMGEAFQEPPVQARFRQLGDTDARFGQSLSGEQRQAAMAGKHDINDLDLIRIRIDGTGAGEVVAGVADTEH